MDRDQGRTLTDPGSDALTLRPLTGRAAEMAALQSVLEAAPAYFRIVGGAPPGPAEAQSLFTALPPGKGYDDKFVWGLYSGPAMIGCADVIRGYPTPDKVVIGLLLLAEPWQRHGLGRALLAEGLRRLEALGATLAQVASGSPPAHALYAAAGFTDYDLLEQWVKDWDGG